uniref:glucuronosyltransferase n=1 Tax=Parastrongyloides trichosuri TaxID=131310 RepID=A0A0N5A4Y8_PARTI
MNFTERLLNLITAAVTQCVHVYFSKFKVTNIFKLKYPLKMKQIDDIWNIAQESQSIIANNIPLLDFSSPTSNMIYNVAGITVNRENVKLDVKFKNIAEINDNFFLITFGSIAKTSDMPISMKISLFNAFKYFPNTTFILKYENIKKDIFRYSGNVFLVKWLPQLSLMSHKNYKGIITHGGWSSMLESLINGKPMILMPLFADHGKNAKIIEQKNLGLLINKMNINSETFSDSIKKLSVNDYYENNCKKYASMLLKPGPIDSEKMISHVVKISLNGNRKKFLKIKSPNILNIYFVDTFFFLLIFIFIFSN